MLLELRIRNVAVIDRVELPLAAGLTVLTGETGAGKSIIVEALGMLLGERAMSDRVRAGADRAVIEGVFAVQALPGIEALLDARGVDTGHGELVIRREVHAAGRSRAWINGSPVTAAVLAEVGARLVRVHGQHDARLLLDAEVQRDLLDAFAGAAPLRARVAAQHAEAQRLRREEDRLVAAREAAAQRAGALRQVARDVEALAPAPGEDDALDAEIRRLSHAEELRAQAAQAAAAIGGDDAGALARLRGVRRALATLARIDPSVAHWQDSLETASGALEALAAELESYADGVEADPARLRALEDRRDRLLALLRRHGPTIDEALAAAASARAELALVEGDATALEHARRERARAERELQGVAAELGALRRDAAARLGDAVTALLPELGLPHGAVRVEVEALDAIGPAGTETVQLLARLDAGAPLRPLARIASGGELSRVMLALSTVLGETEAVPTLVFDEIDAGIGGVVAHEVGALMRRAARHRQVLAVSHLAQIAACAQHHVVVRKATDGAVTTADAAPVSGEARVAEVARLLGGDADREVSRAHARELLAAVERPGRQRRGKPVK
jgi:DNA repair protein RecN (Recombination protein N)